MNRWKKQDKHDRKECTWNTESTLPTVGNDVSFKVLTDEEKQVIHAGRVKQSLLCDSKEHICDKKLFLFLNRCFCWKKWWIYQMVKITS